jgi:type I restriction enzyme R subunit
MAIETSSLLPFLEKHVSRIPALQMLQNLGYVFLRPQDAHLERKGKLSNILLEGILDGQLRRLNRIRFKGREHEFSDANIQAAIEALKDAPLSGGLMAAGRRVYDLLSLGKSLEQTIDGDTKSFPINYVDWRRPERNVFHAVEEFEIQTQGGGERRLPDIILFVNGIPFTVIECGRPDEKDAIEEAISRHLRNQHGDQIPRLFVYSQLLLSINGDEAAYATTGTKSEFWSRWREGGVEDEVTRLANRPLTRQQKENLYAGRGYLRQYFDELEMEHRPATAQDTALYGLCRPERLIELARQFIVFGDDAKKIARHQQYFAVKKAIEQIENTDEDGRRAGGVIWHAQGSGRFLTLVMLAKAIALAPAIRDPRLVIVSDRAGLDDQIRGTFKSCAKEPLRASTGKHLLELLLENRAALITTATDRFETALRAQSYQGPTNDIFILVDESNRNPYGDVSARLRKLLPDACYIGFTGTPLKRNDKNAATEFGGIIDAYTIDQAVRDRAVTPLLHENRRIARDADRQALNAWFERATKELSPRQRRDLKQKMSPAKRPEERIRLIAWEIGEHFRRNIEPPFKAMLAAESKIDAVKYKQYLDEFGAVTAEAFISSPDDETSGEEEIRTFWKRVMERYGNEKEYHRAAINAFKNADAPEILIVVDDLLSDFDAPRNKALYLDRSLKKHELPQAVARVNRLHKGKDFGYVIDYCGALGETGGAMETQNSLSEFDEEDLAMALTGIAEETAKLAGRHSELWEIFKEFGASRDLEQHERALADEARRERFYEKFSAFNRAMSVAFSSVNFINDTSREKLERYKKDLVFFQTLRVHLKRRYAEEIDHREYEAKQRKLIDGHVTSIEGLQIAPLASIFDRGKFRAEIETLDSAAAKADTIAHRTKKTITEKMEEAPFFYRRLSKTLLDVIEDWREGRTTDAEYLNRATEIEAVVLNRVGDDLPAELHTEAAKAFYGLVNEVFSQLRRPVADARAISIEAALKIDEIVRRNRVVDWTSSDDAQNVIRNEIDDYLYELKEVRNVELGLDEMDRILDGAIRIARTRYPQ